MNYSLYVCLNIVKNSVCDFIAPEVMSSNCLFFVWSTVQIRQNLNLQSYESEKQQNPHEASNFA